MYEEASLVARYFGGGAVEELKSAKLSPLAQKYGLQLSHATETVQPILCPPDMLEKLGLQKPIPILLLTRVTFTLTSVPVETRTAWCHLRDKHYMTISR